MYRQRGMAASKGMQQVRETREHRLLIPWGLTLLLAACFVSTHLFISATMPPLLPEDDEAAAIDAADHVSVDDDEDDHIDLPPPLWSLPAHFRVTRRGKIHKNVSERYLRDDLGLGYRVSVQSTTRKTGGAIVPTTGPARRVDGAPELLTLLVRPPSSSSSGAGGDGKKMRVVVCDANVLLHNLDVLEHPSHALSNIVVPQTALLECKHRSLTAYGRVVELLRSSSATSEKSQSGRCCIFFPDVHHVETQPGKKSRESTINDENDRRIRMVAELYGSSLAGTGVEVVLLTDDAGSRARALKEQEPDDDDDDNSGADHGQALLYHPRSVRDHIRLLEKEDCSLGLSDVVAQFSTSGGDGGSAKTKMFAQHLPQADLSLGVKSGKYYQGHIRAERGTSDQFYVTVRKVDERVAVTIVGAEDANRAVDGDVVAIELHSVDKWLGADGSTKDKEKPAVGIAVETAEPTVGDQDNVQDKVEIEEGASEASSLRRPTGKVVGIIRRNFRQNYCGSIYTASSPEEDDGATAEPRKRTERETIADEHELEHPDGTTTCVFFAVDGRVPPILLRTSQRDRLLGHRILVAIDSWPVDSRYPLGHYVKTIGESGNKDVETEVLLHEHNIPCDPFPAKVLACLPPEDYKIDIENSPGREDLRHLPVLSIDPPGCKDIDDALHCVVLPNGNYQVGVHIADVTHYVKAGTAIDLEAANRSTSTYLVNKRLDMLPGLLTTDLCSLKGNVDRYAFSVLWEVTPDADIVDVDFKKTIIHSIAALTYQQAQALIDQPKDDGSDIQAGAVKRLASLARKLRAKRIEAGALTLASPEVKFALDSESLNPTDVQAYTLYEANAVVEEFMLFANVTVSKKILRHYPTLSILRRHPAPNRGMFDTLISKAKCRGVTINIDDSKRLADSLDDAQIESDPYFNKLLRILSTRCMSPAQYFCSGEYKATDWHHYGLAAPVYTHFTSPIRRYADVCVHRLLAAAIGVDPLPVHLSSKSYLHDLAANMNRRHRAAQLAGRASVQLHTLIFFSGANSGGKEEDAYVLDVDTSDTAEPSFTVIVPRYGIEGRVKLPNIAADDPNLVRHVEQHRVQYKSPKTGEVTASVQVFEKVSVKIWVRTIQENQKELVLDLIEPIFGIGAAKNSIVTAGTGKKRKGPGASNEASSSAQSPTGKKKKSKKKKGAK